MSRSAPQHDTGFSLVELIATLVVIGILAAFAMPRMVGRTSFEARGVYDQAQAAIRYAQKVAIAQRRSPPSAPIYVVIAPTQVAICYDAGCASPVIDPSTGGAVVVNAPAGVALSPATSFTFSGSGVPSMTGQLTLTVSSSGAGDVDRVFYVEPITGYVHD